MDQNTTKQNKQAEMRTADTVVDHMYRGLDRDVAIIANSKVRIWHMLLLSMFFTGGVSAMFWAADYFSSTRAEEIRKPEAYFEERGSDARKSPKPDLVIEKIYIQYSSDNQYRFIARWKNQGLPVSTIIAADITLTDLGTGETYHKDTAGGSVITPGVLYENEMEPPIRPNQSGDYRIRATIDETNQFDESNEKNNSYRATLKQEQLLDLAAQGIAGIEPKGDKKYSLLAQVMNNSALPITEDVVFRIVDRTEGETVATARKELSVKHPLPPLNSAIASSEPVTLKKGKAYDWEVVVDPKNRISETDESNNRAPAGGVFIPKGPAVYDWKVRYDSPNEKKYPEGRDFTFRYTITNASKQDQPGINYRVDRYWDGLDLGSMNTTQPLPPGQSIALSDHAGPERMTPGTHTLTLILKVNGQDDNLANNTVTAKIRVGDVKMPDLTSVYIILSPPSPAVGQPTDITVTYKNIGTAPVTADFNAGIDFGQFDGKFAFKDNNAIPDTSGPYPSARDPLEPGEIFGETYHGSFTQTGAHNLEVTVDAEDRIAELDETNNTFTKMFEITPIGTLNVSLDSSSPPAGLLPANTSGITVGTLRLDAMNEDVQLEKIILALYDSDTNGGGPDQIDEVWITTPTQTFGIVPTSTDADPSPQPLIFDLSLNPITVPSACTPGTCPIMLTIKVDTANVDRSNHSKGASGEGFRLAIANGADIRGKGMSSGQVITGEPVTLHEFTLYRSVPTVDTAQGIADTITGNGVYELFKFKVSADQKGPIGIYKPSFEISNKGVSLSNFELYDSSYTSGPVAISDTMVFTPPTGAQGPYGLNMLFDTDGSGIMNGGDFREIPAGTSRTFTLKATISGYAPSQINEVATKLLGDTQFPSPVMACAGETYGNNACYGIDAQTSPTPHEYDNFIWTDFSYTLQYNSSTATNTAEWTNGFRVKGLPPDGTSPQVI